MSLDLVLLAAGRGRRFGGFKQTAPVGPHGQALCEYTIFEALEAGFTRIVIVCTPDSADDMRRWADERFGRRAAYSLALQDCSDAPAERNYPWGTGHAVLAAAGQVQGPFAVANADDHYGPWAFVILTRFLTRQAQPDLAGRPATWATVGFPLLETLPHTGAVSRAECVVGEHGMLRGLQEHKHIERQHELAFIATPGRPRVPIPEETPVSLNAWAFTPAIFAVLRDGFARFKRDADLRTEEFRLPVAVGEAITTALATVRILPGADEWFGLTHPDDVVPVRRRLAELTAAGRYPARLWT